MLEVDQAEEHAGVFTVRITKSGYKDWVRNDIQVVEGTCHVRTVTVQVRLAPVAS